MKILIISNNAFFLSSSNGRTLGKLLGAFDKDDLMQFCISGDCVSEELIKYSYCIKDRQMLNGFFKRHVCSTWLPIQELESKKKYEPKSIGARAIRRTAFSMLIREFVWKFGYKKTDFVQYACKFSPDVVLYQMGDNAFLADMAIDLAEKCRSQIVVYSTEDYYFKKWNYLSGNRKEGVLYCVFRKNYRKSINKLLSISQLLIANTPDLARRYQKRFGIRTDYIMASASDFDDVESQNRGRVLYAGGLGVGRHKSLIEIARALHKYGMELDVYGTGNEDVMKELAAEPNICLKGFVPYDTVKSVMKGAKLVIHAESFDNYYRKDCVAAFSTKIPDCLACGVPLLIYAPREMAVTKYLIVEKCAFVCTDRKELKSIIKKALTDESERKGVLINAKNAVMRNHDSDKNSLKMRKCLEMALV